MGVMPDYEVNVERDGRYLLVRIPALDGVTQARFPGEVEPMAADYVALVTETPIEDVTICVRGTVPAFSTPDYEAVCAELLSEIVELRDRLATTPGD